LSLPFLPSESSRFGGSRGFSERIKNRFVTSGISEGSILVIVTIGLIPSVSDSSSPSSTDDSALKI
jgi:hypothetical protein